jgi:predicted DNA-binding WGR domain protein/uncharacterized protein YwqG
MKKKRLEYRDAISHKYWETSRQGTTVTVRWGRIGTKGQQQKKRFESIDEARSFMEKALAGKIKKGYAAPSSLSRTATTKLSLEKALDAGPRRKRMPGDFTAAYRQWQALERMLPVESRNSETVTRINKCFSRASWAWEASGSVVKFSEIDRLGQSYGGPPYTCKGYEWPIAPQDYPCLPLVQIDLRKASNICGVDIGNGLLQLFNTLSFDWPSRGMSCPYFLRVIPRNRISRAELTAIPSWTEAQLKNLSNAAIQSNEGELSPDYKCLQIRVFDKKKFSFPNAGSISSHLDQLIGSELTKEGQESKQFEERSDDLAQALSNLSDKNKADTYLFGSFYGIQYEPEEETIPLFCMDGGYGEYDFWDRFQFGDAGNGQIFISGDRPGNAGFHFNWSCY